MAHQVCRELLAEEPALLRAPVVSSVAGCDLCMPGDICAEFCGRVGAGGTFTTLSTTPRSCVALPSHACPSTDRVQWYVNVKTLTAAVSCTHVYTHTFAAYVVAAASIFGDQRWPRRGTAYRLRILAVGAESIGRIYLCMGSDSMGGRRALAGTVDAVTACAVRSTHPAPTFTRTFSAAHAVSRGAWKQAISGITLIVWCVVRAFRRSRQASADCVASRGRLSIACAPLLTRARRTSTRASRYLLRHRRDETAAWLLNIAFHISAPASACMPVIAAATTAGAENDVILRGMVASTAGNPRRRYRRADSPLREGVSSSNSLAAAAVSDKILRETIRRNGWRATAWHREQ